MVSTLEKFSMEVGNKEAYLANNFNLFYQNKRPEFKGVTFQMQSKLPSLPIPELEATLSKYLVTIKPFCTSDEQFENQKLLCEEFIKTSGPLLQQRLLEYARTTRNWMSEFWDNQAYLEYNDPIVPYVSYFYVHKPLPISHKDVEEDILAKSTAIIMSVLKFAEAIKNESLPIETNRDIPLCMNSFRLMFNNSRIPGNKRDSNIFYSIYENNFITVAYQGNFYKVYTHDQETEKILTAYQIWKQLYDIITKISGKIKTETSKGIGSLTSLPRDEWFKVYESLNSNVISKNSLEIIHKSLFLLCLDDNYKPISLEDKSRNCWYGDGINRYYDKPLQFIVCKNGSSGFLAEHSKMDGSPTLLLNNFVCEELQKLNPVEFLKSIKDPCETNNLSSEHLPFIITPDIQQSIQIAQNKFKKIINEHDLRVWNYIRYGKQVIKQLGFSPDAYIQQVIQLGIYKYLGKVLPTYEAASTRKYFKGRTETGRSVSVYSTRFVSNWENNKISDNEKILSLRVSAKHHSNYLKMASEGQGIDRHFFGLKNMLKPTDVTPALFNDPLFLYSSTWLISTSQLTSEYFEGYGWSQVNDNGIGLAYMINNDSMNINIVTKPEKSGLNVNELHYYLTQAADEIFELLCKNKESKAKL